MPLSGPENSHDFFCFTYYSQKFPPHIQSSHPYFQTYLLPPCHKSCSQTNFFQHPSNSQSYFFPASLLWLFILRVWMPLICLPHSCLSVYRNLTLLWGQAWRPLCTWSTQTKGCPFSEISWGISPLISTYLSCLWSFLCVLFLPTRMQTSGEVIAVIFAMYSPWHKKDILMGGILSKHLAVGMNEGSPLWCTSLGS